MSIEKYYIVGWWRQCKKTKETVAKEIETFLLELGKIDSRFEDLYELGRSVSKSVGKKIDPSYDGILKYMKEDKQFPQLGYDYWVLGPDECITISINESCWSKPNNPANNVMIDFSPIVDESLSDFLKVDVIIKIIQATVKVFKPVEGGMISANHREKVYNKGKPFTSWVQYLSIPVDTIPPMPEGVRVLPIDESGTLIVTVPELFDAENERHIAIAAEITKRLDEAGILDKLDCTKYVPTNEL
jgi:hypothetical protein